MSVAHNGIDPIIGLYCPRLSRKRKLLSIFISEESVRVLVCYSVAASPAQTVGFIFNLYTLFSMCKSPYTSLLIISGSVYGGSEASAKRELLILAKINRNVVMFSRTHKACAAKMIL